MKRFAGFSRSWTSFEFVVRGRAPAVGMTALLLLGHAVVTLPEESQRPEGATSPVQRSSDLDAVSRAREDEAILDALSISDAGIDSLIRSAQKAHESEEEGLHHRWELDFGVAGITYNRVEGVNASLAASLAAPTSRTLRLFAEGGYSWALEKPAWRTGLGADFPGAVHPTIEVAQARQIVPFGSGGIPGNSLNALLFGRDYHDWYSSEQWSASLGVAPGPLAFHLGIRLDEQSSVRNHTDFSFFDEDRFRPNPSIDDGEARILSFAADYGRDSLEALGVALEVAAAGRVLGGDFEYETLRAELLWRGAPGLGLPFVAKLSGGTLGGSVPFQALHHLGGFATLRGYETNEFPAREFAHLRFDCPLGKSLARALPGSSRLRLELVPFLDGAAIFATQARDGSIQRPEDPAFLFSAGIGLQNRVSRIRGGTGNLRFDIARRLDREHAAMTYRLGVTIER
jgi:hypothetical protein